MIYSTKCHIAQLFAILSCWAIAPQHLPVLLERLCIFIFNFLMVWYRTFFISYFCEFTIFSSNITRKFWNQMSRSCIEIMIWNMPQILKLVIETLPSSPPTSKQMLKFQPLLFTFRATVPKISIISQKDDAAGSWEKTQRDVLVLQLPFNGISFFVYNLEWWYK